MRADRRAFVDVMMRRALTRAASDAEDQVARWLVDGVATLDDLREARKLTRRARQLEREARERYRSACVVGSGGVA